MVRCGIGDESRVRFGSPRLGPAQLSEMPRVFHVLLLLVCIAQWTPLSVSSVSSSSISSPYPFSEYSLFDESDSLPPSIPAALLGTLTHVQLVHRHGDRAPVHIHPADVTDWSKAGLRAGQLSSIGAAQLRALGRFLRLTYASSDFLPPVVNPAARPAVRVRSTDVDRCLQSAHALLDGLYPGSMVPVHTVPEDSERLLQPTDKCPSYLLAYRAALADADEDAIKRLTTVRSRRLYTSGIVAAEDDGGSQLGVQTFDLLSHLAASTGWGSTLSPAQLVSVATDNLICLAAHGLEVHPEVAAALPRLRNHTKSLLFHKFSPTHVRRAWSRTKATVDAAAADAVADENADSNDAEKDDDETDDDDMMPTRPFRMPDEMPPNAGRGMDPRGAVGAEFADHLVRHWEDVLEVQRRVVGHTSGRRRALLGVAVSEEDAKPLPPSPRLPRLLARPAASSAASSAASARDTAATRTPPPPPRRLSSSLAAERVHLYSAHDTTLLALFQSLALITSPESEYLYPPFGASITLELRHKSDAETRGADAAPSDDPLDGYFVNAFYGFPRLIGPVASQRRDSDESWTYHRHPIALRCLSEVDAAADQNVHTDTERASWRKKRQWQCSLGDFKRFLAMTSRSATARATESDDAESDADATSSPLVISPSAATLDLYPPLSGCCERTASFYARGCAASGVEAVASLANECLAFRRRCPFEACAPSERLDPRTLSCEPDAEARPCKHQSDADREAAVAAAAAAEAAKSNKRAAGLAWESDSDSGPSVLHTSSSSSSTLLFLACLFVALLFGGVYACLRVVVGGGGGDRVGRREEDGDVDSEAALLSNNVSTSPSPTAARFQRKDSTCVSIAAAVRRAVRRARHWLVGARWGSVAPSDSSCSSAITSAAATYATPRVIITVCAILLWIVVYGIIISTVAQRQYESSPSDPAGRTAT